MTGPSTNFYVGPENNQYTIPKRLIYRYSEYARVCLEGKFPEAAANAIWLPDVDPKVFQLLWRWLHSDTIDIDRYISVDDIWWGMNERKERQIVCQRACQLLCRLHILCERLLFDYRFLRGEVQRELDSVIARAETSPFTVEIIQEVLANSAPVHPEAYCSITSLRPFLLEHWSNFCLCTTINFYDYVECFEQDGRFAAAVMAYMAWELMWVVSRWGKQTESVVDLDEKKKEFYEKEGLSQSMVKSCGRRQGVWLVCRYMCTFKGCTTTYFPGYSHCFELDGGLAAEIMTYMAEELVWAVDRWGTERGSKVDFTAEKAEEEIEDLLQSFIDKASSRG